MEIPVIHTPRLTLRGYRPTDLAPLQAMVSDRETIQYFPRTEPWPAAVLVRWMASLAEHWETYGYGWFVMADRVHDTTLGWCGLRRLEETGEVEVLYLLGKAYWGQGLATEAARRCVEDGFRRYGMDLIVGLTHRDNTGSQRVLEKSGLVFGEEAPYFGMTLFRHTIDRARFAAVYGA
ncbi:MAG: GNAT family N-acetyltransferase [Caldilineaceae bacterium]|nr:GNAT family N-acetyltransferase [Caldilineaceae bacterium]